MQIADIVSNTDFNQLPYNVPDNQVQELGTGTVMDNTKFSQFISDSVDTILIDLLGLPFYQLFVSFINTLNVWDVAKADYVINDEVLYAQHVWRCLVNAPAVGVAPAEGSDWTMIPDTIMLQFLYGSSYGIYPSKQYVWKGLKAMLVPYVFSQWIGNTNREYVNGAVIVKKFANADLVSISDKATRAYNDFSKQVNSMCGFLLDKFKSYTYDGVNFDDSIKLNSLSFSTYLIHYFQDPGTTNMFDI